MGQDDLYQDVTASFGAALGRLARSYEADPDKQRDLLQDIHFAIWRSLAVFSGQCSLRTWIYRVAHNVAASHLLKNRRERTLRSLADFELAADANEDATVDRQITLERLYGLIQHLKPVDREVILLYLENLDAASIGEVTGISAANVATRIHRIKKVLANGFRAGARDGK